MNIVTFIDIEPFRLLQKTLSRLANPDCEDCGGTGDVDPDEWGLRPCRCVLECHVLYHDPSSP